MKRFFILAVLCALACCMSAQLSDREIILHALPPAARVQSKNIPTSFYPRRLRPVSAIGIAEAQGSQSHLDSLVNSLFISLNKNFYSSMFNGVPLVFPQIQKEDPLTSLILVSNDSVELRIDRAYIVHKTKDYIDWQKDIYRLDSICCYQDDDGGVTDIVALVTRNKDSCSIDIDASILKQVLNINKDEASFPSNLQIPVIYQKVAADLEPHE